MLLELAPSHHNGQRHVLTRALNGTRAEHSSKYRVSCACRRHQRCQCRKRRLRCVTAFLQLSDEPSLARNFLRGVSDAKHNRVSRNKRSAPSCRQVARRLPNGMWRFIWSSVCSASGQRIFDALAQPANCVAVEFLISDFQLGRRKRFGWQFLDHEPDCVRRAGKTSVSDGQK